ncbi:MAG: hypothetical protein ERJ67_08020 [Aphanocapsa feldmannii 277cV]|uniref:Uncharacterized protein n=1 Tax=Aphanocapsa feldmannii 277cV TaxID=2507553 RepID=A0A524RN78_9CHRO|nr:MAG: hypothetical protein ERJ67_08020 [Aphanocapsa feldmannii 277cV]
MRAIPFFVLGLNALAVALAIALIGLTGHNHFEEKGFVTIFSAVQLLILAGLAWRTFRWRSIADGSKGAGGGAFWRRSSLLWLLAAVGFVFLAADELFQIHEGLDRLIHTVLDLRETAISDRLDDLIIGIYALVAVAVLVAYRAELRLCRARLPLLVWGLVLLLVMVFLDVLTNRYDILTFVFGGRQALILGDGLARVEESLKLFAEALFVLAFHGLCLHARQLAVQRPARA